VNIALFLIRLLLATVFVVAGVAKLVDRGGTRQAVTDFGVPSPLVAPLGVLLPLAELTVAAALLFAPTAWWGALGALVFLLLFAAGIGANLARGRRPECHCFGQLRSEPVGWKTLARNLVLAAAAGFFVWRGYGGAGPGAVGWLAGLSSFQVAGLLFGLAALGLICGQWLFLSSLLDQNGRILLRLDALEQERRADTTPSSEPAPAQPSVGLPVGSAAPEFELRDLRGEAHTLAELRAAEKPVMLLFTDPDCAPCTVMFPEIRRWQKEYDAELTVSLVSRGTVQENRARSTEHGLRGLLLQDDWEVWEAYGVDSTPGAVFVEPNGTIGSPVLEGADSISAFLEYTMRESDRGARGDGAAQAAAEAPTVGSPAPHFELPDLNGATVDLGYFEGEKVIVMFWDPGCGYCGEMLPDVRAWEDDLYAEAPKLLVVSTGTQEANREMGLSSPVLLDEHLTVGRDFGAPGSPSAVIVDEHGKIASELAVGAPAVLSVLARSSQEHERTRA
jgi:peroxiredoxin